MEEDAHGFKIREKNINKLCYADVTSLMLKMQISTSSSNECQEALWGRGVEWKYN